MPITVKHGPETFNALAALALQAGASQQPIPEARLSGLPSYPAVRGGGGPTRTTGPPQPWGGEVTPREQSPEEAMALELQQKKEEAKIQAEQWEYQYSAKDRQEIARFNAARQRIRGNPNFSEEEKGAAIRLIDIQQAGIEPSMMPRDPNKPQFAEGQEPGVPWKDPETGATMTTVIGSSGQPEAKLLVRPDQTQEYMERQEEIKQAQAERDREMKRSEDIEKMRRELATELIPRRDETGVEKAGTRLRKPWEVQDIMKRAFPELQPSYAEQIDEQRASWWTASEQQGMKITNAEKQMPPAIGQAVAYARITMEKYKTLNKVPSNILDELEKSYAIIEQYRLSEGMSGESH